MSKRKQHRQHLKNDFDAGLQMQKQAQKDIDARLRSLEIIADNQIRRRAKGNK